MAELVVRACRTKPKLVSLVVLLFVLLPSKMSAYVTNRPFRCERFAELVYLSMPYYSDSDSVFGCACEKTSTIKYSNRIIFHRTIFSRRINFIASRIQIYFFFFNLISVCLSLCSSPISWVVVSHRFCFISDRFDSLLEKALCQMTNTENEMPSAYNI